MSRRTYPITNLRAWREYRALSLDEAVALLAELANEPLTKTSLSRIETGKQPYSQPILEGLAVVYQTTPAALLAHTPIEGAAVTRLWDRKLDETQPLPPPVRRNATPKATRKQRK